MGRRHGRDPRTEYRDWLIANFGLNNELDYILEVLFDIEFYSLVKYDEDRAMDGLVLRDEWAEYLGFDDFGDLVGSKYDFGAANVLEVLIGIAKRIEFQLFGSIYMDDWGPVEILWNLIENLGLTDEEVVHSCDTFERISSIVTLFLSRENFRHKKCHIFTFETPPKGLKNMNIWSQMTLYIREKWPK